jgi:hypothetical protein
MCPAQAQRASGQASDKRQQIVLLAGTDMPSKNCLP